MYARQITALSVCDRRVYPAAAWSKAGVERWTTRVTSPTPVSLSNRQAPNPLPACHLGRLGRSVDVLIRKSFLQQKMVSLQTMRALCPRLTTLFPAVRQHKSLTFKGVTDVRLHDHRSKHTKRAHWPARSRFLFICSSLFLRWKLYLKPNVCFSKVGVWRSDGQF